MIKRTVKVTYKNSKGDTKPEVFECAEQPSVGSPWVSLYLASDRIIYLTSEGIERIEVKEKWQRK